MTALFTTPSPGPVYSGASPAVLTLSSSTAGRPMLAVLVASSAAAFSGPANWQRAKTVAAGGTAAGHIEIWYLKGKYNAGGVTSASFTSSASSVTGQVTELPMSQPGMDIVLDAPGQAAGSGGGVGTMNLAAACGNAPDSFGVALFADFFSAGAGTGTTWTGPWTLLGQVNGNVTTAWYAGYNLDLSQAIQSVTAGYSTTTNETGWCGAMAVFRAARFRQLGQNGGEMLNTVAPDPTGQVLLAGGDVEGIWRSANDGDDWQQVGVGLYTNSNSCATLLWDPTLAGVCYAGVGQSGSGGLLVSSDGGFSWSLRSSGVSFKGADSGSPPRPSTQDAAMERWVGNLLSIDATNGYMYACDPVQGVMRSHSSPLGTGWTAINSGIGTPLYVRAIVANPANPKELWIGCWSTTTSNGGVWHCPDATVTTPSWTRLTGWTGTVGDLHIAGGYVYAACDLGGVYRVQIGNTVLVSLNGGGTVSQIPVNGTATCNGLGVYVDGSSNHIVWAVIGSSVKPSGAGHVYCNLVQITLPGGSTSGISWSDVTNATNTAGNLNVSTLPPDGRSWWKATQDGNFQNWLGGSAFKSSHLTLNPVNTSKVYIAGTGGFWRSLDGGTTLETACNGMCMVQSTDVVIDPANSTHICISGDDYATTDFTDPLGLTSGATKVIGLGSGIMSHAIAMSPADSTVFAGSNQKYGKATGGGVYARHPATTTGATEIGYIAATGHSATPSAAPAVVGLFCGQDASSHVFLLALAQGGGLYRAALTPSADPTLAASWTWSLATGGGSIAGSGVVGQFVPFTSKTGKTIFLFDRLVGIYRSTDYGVTWTLITPTSGSGRIVSGGGQETGFLALNPSVSGELWISTNSGANGLLKMSGAGAGIVGAAGGPTVTTITSSGSPANPGGLAWYNGSLYVISLPSGSNPVKLLITSDGGATWAQADASGEIGSYVTDPRKLVISSAGQAVLNTDYNGYVTGSVAPVTPPTLTVTTSGALTGGQVGVTYSAGIASTGGVQPYTYTLNSGSIPAGLTLNSDGSITGTPTTAGTSSFTVKNTDSATPTPNTATSSTITITITTAGLAILTTSLPNGQVGVVYDQPVEAAYGTPPYSWTLAAGSGPLPPGLSLSSTSSALYAATYQPVYTESALISGTPASAAGLYPITVQVTDSASPTPAVATAPLSIQLTPPTLTVTGTPPPAQELLPYTYTLAAFGGVPPYTWSLTDTGGGTGPPTNVLPAGLTLNGATGVISGTPLTPGTTIFTPLVTDSIGSTAYAFLTLTVSGGPTPMATQDYDSLVLADQIELLGGPGGLPSTNAACPGAIFHLQPGYSLGEPQPVSTYVSSLALDGEHPFGRRASNRTITFDVQIEAPTFAILEAAREVLMQAVDQDFWTLRWTRAQSTDPAPLPLVLECFRALPTVNMWGGADQWNINPIAQMTLTFVALPYGRSDTPVQVSVAPPVPAGPPPPPPPVTIDSFTSVSGSSNWFASTTCIIGPNTIHWDPRQPPISDADGVEGVAAVYSANITPVNITGLTSLSVWAGLGSDFYDTWDGGPVTFNWVLTDIWGHNCSFSRVKKLHPSNSSAAPKWELVTATILQLPQGTLSGQFDYTNVASYKVSVLNTDDSLRWTQLYLDTIVANPGALVTPSVRGSIYTLTGVEGTARTPLQMQFQQQAVPGGAPTTSILPGPPGAPQLWVAPSGVTTVQAEVTGPGGTGGKTHNSGWTGGGGGGGEYRANPAVPVTAGTPYVYKIGAGGTSQASSFTGDSGTTVVANAGGAGGTSSASGAGGAGGSGGTGTTGHNGGAGAAGSTTVYGGGGGGSGGSSSAGNPGSTYHGGAAVTGGGAGGAGSNGDGNGSPGGNPGGGGGGARTGTGLTPYSGGVGAQGQVKLTYVPPSASFSTLIVHRPGPDAPANLNPLVTFSQADGVTEYPVASLQPGQTADFNGTYTVVLVANSWDSPTVSRTLSVTVRQYEYPGGPSYDSTVSRTITPANDTSAAIGYGVSGLNGITVIGELTLPKKALDAVNTAAFYTVIINDSHGSADTWFDCMFLDSMGQVMIVNVPTPAAYLNFFVDAPEISQGLGLVLGSAFDRAQAVSVLDSTPVYSGGPMFAYPGDNNMLVYCVEGAPALSVTYFPRWFLGRTQ